jgi:hypothetical protein
MTHIKPVLSLAEFRVSAGCVKVGAATALDIEIKNLGMMQVTGVKSADPRFTATMAFPLSSRAMRLAMPNLSNMVAAKFCVQRLTPNSEMTWSAPLTYFITYNT